MIITDKFSVRQECIFCKNKLEDEFFKTDLKNFVSHYAVDEKESNFHLIPYNVFTCGKCKTVQLKYLGDIDEVYKINHADGTGITMQKMHEKKLNLIIKHKDNVDGIIEIGSSRGILSDLILEKMNVDYNIIEPSYFGSLEKKNIINDYYENVDDKNIKANTIIMSHVFEHFYKPLDILNKIHENSNIKNIFLTFPNLEKYISNDIHHVLNTEHTYYVDNDFIKDLFESYGFELVESDFYKNHSVFFYFRRTNNEVKNVVLYNKKHNISNFFEKIYETVDMYNNIIDNNLDKNIYMFPASCHSIFLSIFGLKYQSLFGMLDNSPNKIGKYVYGLGTKIFSLKETIKNDKNFVLLINGGVFNEEIKQELVDNNVEYYTL